MFVSVNIGRNLGVFFVCALQCIFFYSCAYVEYQWCFSGVFVFLVNFLAFPVETNGKKSGISVESQKSSWIKSRSIGNIQNMRCEKTPKKQKMKEM